ncbi:hypothetical protein [Nonomuraea sp. NPDC005701]|uniref:WD40 repeat domain-containing protein n=1 Tax=Nonomuraea sp. NPDC005701 TaxID=3157049 RepID=UPI0033C713E9
MRLWDIATHRQIGAPLTGHTWLVSSVAFSPNGRTLATGAGKEGSPPFELHLINVPAFVRPSAPPGAQNKRKQKKNQYRPHLLTGCLTGIGLTIVRSRCRHLSLRIQPVYRGRPKESRQNPLRLHNSKAQPRVRIQTNTAVQDR